MVLFAISISNLAYAKDSYDPILQKVYRILKPIEKNTYTKGGINRIRIVALRLQELLEIHQNELGKDEKEDRLKALKTQLKEDLRNLDTQVLSIRDSIPTEDLLNQIDLQIYEKKGKRLDPKIKLFLARVKDHIGLVKSGGFNLTVDEIGIAGVGGGIALGKLITPLGREYVVAVLQGTMSVGIGAQLMGGYYQFDMRSDKLAGLSHAGEALWDDIEEQHGALSGGLLVGITIDKNRSKRVIEGGLSAGAHIEKKIEFLSFKLFPILSDHKHLSHYGEYKHIKRQLGLIQTK
jgi:hypothetical protein